MAVAFVGGAALGAAFGELFRAIMEAKDTVSEFRPQLDKLSSTLSRIRPIIDDIESFNRVLDRVGEMDRIQEMMTRGVKLVKTSAKVGKVNVIRKYQYSKKLDELNKSVAEFFAVDAQAVIVRDGKEILVEVQGLSQEVKMLTHTLEANVNGSMVKSGGGYFVDYLVPQAPGVVIGGDAGRCFKGIKGKLLQGGFLPTVVSAPGGCGKTTLVTALCHDEEIKGKFCGNILFIPISKTPNLVDIVQRMALRAGFVEARSESKVQPGDYLRQLLLIIGQKPLLIVLDDVWSDSESMLEKFVVTTLPDYKILVTSRFEFPAFGESHRLKPLSRGESAKLFNRMAIVEGSRFGPPDKQVLDQLVDACKGLPLALTIVGKSLCGHPPSKWERKRDELSKGKSVVGSNSEIFDCLKKSLDDFDGDDVVAKECFLDLSSFPEDHKIPAAALIDMWTELYDLDSDAHAISILHELSARSMVNLFISRKDAGESDGCYQGHQVTVHDLLRDLAIMECNQWPLEDRKRLIVDLSGSKIPDWWIEQDPMPVNARLTAITAGSTFPPSWPNLDLPQTEVLLLNIGTSTCSLPDFIRKMGKLKSLLVSNRYFRPAKLSNFDYIFSISTLKRIRLERVVLPPLSSLNAPLRNLKKLSLFMCNVSSALLSCETQVSCLMPSLIELNIDYCIDLVKLPAGLCELMHLKKLSITNCHELSELPERMGNITQLEVLRLSSCTNLAELPDLIANLKELTFLDISDCLKIKKLPDRTGELVNLSKLYMRGCLNLSSLPSSMKRLENLRKVICDKEKEGFFKSLKTYNSSSHNNLEIVAAKEEISLSWMFD